MLVAPDIDQSAIIACLRSEYGVDAETVAFLAVGADADTAAYRVVAQNGDRFFLKLRSGDFLDASVSVPHYLASHGAGWVIGPIPTRSGVLSADVTVFTAVLYPFHDGTSGWNRRLSREQWIKLGAGVRTLHDAEIPIDLLRAVPRESFRSPWRRDLPRRLEQLREDSAGDPVIRELSELLERHRSTVEHLLYRAEVLAGRLTHRPAHTTACHGDLHAGNILIDSLDHLFVVDWDTIVVALRERDLMFIGGGVGGTWNKQHECEWFFDGYGSVEIDPYALLYYRCERIVEDICVVCSELLESNAAEPDRAEMVRQIADQFGAGNVVEIALRTDETVR